MIKGNLLFLFFNRFILLFVSYQSQIYHHHYRCPVDPNIITKFHTNSDGAQATAILKSMFKFPEGIWLNLIQHAFIDKIASIISIVTFFVFIGSEVHLQCDIQQCNGGCAEESCPGDTFIATFNKGGRALGGKAESDGMLLAATTVFVLDPSEAPRELFYQRCEYNFHAWWLIDKFLPCNYCRGIGCLWRQRYPSSMVTLAGHHIGHTVPDYVADEHIPMYSNELQLCANRSKSNCCLHAFSSYK